MTGTDQPAREPAIPTRAGFTFVALTFLMTWGLISPYILAPELAAAWFGAIGGTHPFFFAATWSPAIAAFVLVCAHAGARGIRAFLSRLLLWRLSPGWVAFILVVLPLVFVAGSLIKGGPVLAPAPTEGTGALVALLFTMLLLGPIEEFGWRGFLQPLLQRRMAPVWAGLIIGAIWGVWHLPAFFLSGTVFAGWNFLPFFVGNVVLAVLVTPVFNRARQPVVADAVSLAAHQPVLARRAALGHLDPGRRCCRGGVVEPGDDVQPRGSGNRGAPLARAVAVGADRRGRRARLKVA